MDEDAWRKYYDAVMGLTFLIRIKIELILREHHVSPFEESVIGFLKMCFASPQPIVKAKWDLEAVEHLQVKSFSEMFLIRSSADFLWNFVIITDSLLINLALSLSLLLAKAFRAWVLS